MWEIIMCWERIMWEIMGNNGKYGKYREIMGNNHGK